MWNQWINPRNYDIIFDHVTVVNVKVETVMNRSMAEISVADQYTKLNMDWAELLQLPTLIGSREFPREKSLKNNETVKTPLAIQTRLRVGRTVGKQNRGRANRIK